MRMKFYMKMIFFMLVALCTTTIPTGHARLLVTSNVGESSHMVKSMLLGPKASPEEFFASVTKSSAEDVLSVSSVPKDSLGDVSVSSVPGASPMIIARKASPEQFSASVPMSSAEPSPGHVSLPSEESSPGLVFIDSVPYIVSESGPYWPPHTVSEPDPWPPSLILS